MSFVKDYFGWIYLTFRNIFRNKRRSFAMISGILLGTLILSGIFVYFDVLQAQSYETVVESAIYEVEFNLLENETIDNLNEVASLIESDNRIIGSSIITQQTGQMFSSVSLERADGEDTEGPPQGPGGISQILPTFVSEQFASSAVGQEMLSETLFQGDLELSENATVIPRSLASQYRLQVGDVLDHLNISVNVASNQVGGEITQNRGTLTNVRIAGIYEIQSGDTGFFGQLFGQSEMYFSQSVLQNYLPEINNLFNQEQARFLATKINIDEFTITQPDTMNAEIQQMINEFSSETADLGYELQGDNTIGSLLTPYEIINVIVLVFQILLVLPVVILSFYLLAYGVQLSLEERRREIGIKKVQGANSKQIFGELWYETIGIFVLGLTLGYMLAIVGAWIISTATNFLQFDFANSISFSRFFTINTTAVVLATILLGGLLFYLVRTRGKEFISSEVSEQIQRFEEKKEGFLRRTNFDIFLFSVGGISAIMSTLVQGFQVSFQISGLLAFVMYGLGPFMLWIGGAAIGIRLAAWVPFKLEKPVFSTRFFEDIQRIIKSGLRRRGDTTRLAIIIILTLSIATLSATQGVTDAYNANRNIEFQVGADYQVNFQVPGDYQTNITEPNSVTNSLAIGRTGNVRILSSVGSVIGFDIGSELERIRNGNNVAIWQSDTFEGITAEQALTSLVDNPNGIIVSDSMLSDLNAEVGETVDFKIEQPLDENTTQIYTLAEREILAVYNFIPGGIAGNNILANDVMVNQVRAIEDGKNLTVYDNEIMNASTYLVDVENAGELGEDRKNDLLSDWSQIEGYNSAISLQERLDQSGSGSYGIPGLLTLNFVVSVAAALIATFTFSAILLERRRQEFAILRAVGASKRQIYKIAMAENLLLVLTTVIWGIIIGMGLSFQFNGLFAFFGGILGAGGLRRVVVFPWSLILIIGIGTTIGMLLATMISVRKAANQDLSIATRVV